MLPRFCQQSCLAVAIVTHVVADLGPIGVLLHLYPPQVKDVLMALYFAADHVVWAHQIGLLQDKRTGERAQKVSLWSWALGSVATMILEANTILAVSRGL